jgi:hypothetical protein
MSLTLWRMSQLIKKYFSVKKFLMQHLTCLLQSILQPGACL